MTALPTPRTLSGKELTVRRLDGTAVTGPSQAVASGLRDTSRPRAIHYDPQAIDRTPAQTFTPTITPLATPTTATWSGARRLPWNGPDVTMLGIIPANTATETAQQMVGNGGTAVYSVALRHTGTRLAVAFKLKGDPVMCRLWVDGVPQAPVTITSQVAAAAVEWTFPTATAREIRVDLRWVELAGVDVDTSATVAAAPRPDGRLLVIGDSYVQGWDGDTPTGKSSIIDPFAYTLGALLGLEAFHHGFGGTGYQNRAPDNHYGSAQRQAMHAKIRPDYTIVFGTQNDGAPTDEAAARTLVRDTYIGLARYSRIFVVGASPYGGGFDPILKKEAIPANRVFGSVYPKDAGWFPNGNEDGVIHWSAHPTPEGQREYARKIAAAFAAAHANAFPGTV